jgi:hypothetical protein
MEKVDAEEAPLDAPRWRKYLFPYFTKTKHKPDSEDYQDRGKTLWKTDVQRFISLLFLFLSFSSLSS